jgi:hypothetical protein
MTGRILISFALASAPHGTQAPGYGQRSLVETTMGRCKALIGLRLHARDLPAQQTEAAIGVAVPNRLLATVRPESVRRQRVGA